MSKALTVRSLFSLVFLIYLAGFHTRANADALVSTVPTNTTTTTNATTLNIVKNSNTNKTVVVDKRQAANETVETDDAKLGGTETSIY